MKFLNLTANLLGITLVNVAQTGAVTVDTSEKKHSAPNIVFVFADQLRQQALGYTGDPNVITPNIDRLAGESVNMLNAISCVPVSCPYRASMLTGQYALSNGIFLNDLQLNPEINSVAKIYKKAGYNTAYIGKWHLNGNGRSKYIKEEFRQGFDYFKALECTHSYLKSKYFDNNDTIPKFWKGYDAIDQTQDAINYMKEHSKHDKPFVLYLSWGGPHSPYEQITPHYKKMYADKEIILRENVPADKREAAIKDLRGYYAQITALDDCIGMLQKAIKDIGIEENTIFVFTSDHGDMLYSQNMRWKQRPYDESIRVPFLIKYPALLGEKNRKTDMIINTPDMLPTLLGLSGIDIPDSIEGDDLSDIITGDKEDYTDAALIECISPFADFRKGIGREYRGLRTKRYTYVRDLNGPWLMFDNLNDPYQQINIINSPEYADIRKELDDKLMKKLKLLGDEFLPGTEYIRKWGYKVDKTGTVPYTN